MKKIFIIVTISLLLSLIRIKPVLSSCVYQESKAIKATVKSCILTEDFFQQKLKEELSKETNYLTNRSLSVDWKGLVENPSWRTGVIVKLDVNENRSFDNVCNEFLSKETSEPYIWKGDWENMSTKEALHTYHWISGNCPPLDKELIFFLDPPCCDTVPPSSLSCAFELGRIKSDYDLLQDCLATLPK